MELKKILLLSLVALEFFIPAYKHVYAEEKLKIGVIAPLSGEGASWGEAVRNGVDIALAKLPKEILDRLELTYEDDGLEPKNTVTALNHLVARGGIDAVISVASGTSKAIAPIAEERKITMLALATDPKVCQGRKYVFNFWVTPDEEMKIVVPEALKRGYKKIASIVTVQDGALAGKAAFDRINKNQIEIIISEEYPSELKDFKPFLTKVRARKDIDALFVILLPGQLGIFARQAREMGIELPLFGFETFEDVNEVKVSNNTLVGGWYVNSADGNGHFVDEYRRRFPTSSLYMASNAHDAMLLIGKAMERGVSKDKLHEFLAALQDFHGALGTYSATGDQRFTLPAALKVVTASGFEELNKDK